MLGALSPPTRGSLFASTRWIVVYQAADCKMSSEHALSALAELCQIYFDELSKEHRKVQEQEATIAQMKKGNGRSSNAYERAGFEDPKVNDQFTVAGIVDASPQTMLRGRDHRSRLQLYASTRPWPLRRRIR
jgi:hypothetical protein